MNKKRKEHLLYAGLCGILSIIALSFIVINQKANLFLSLGFFGGIFLTLRELITAFRSKDKLKQEVKLK